MKLSSRKIIKVKCSKILHKAEVIKKAFFIPMIIYLQTVLSIQVGYAENI